MMIFIQAEDYQCWRIIEQGPLEISTDDAKAYTEEDFKKLEKNAKAIKMLHYGLGPDEYNRVATLKTAKQIWDSLEVAHEGTNEVKQSKIDILVHKYELFHMDSSESIKDMFTRFTNIVNELTSLGKMFSMQDQVRKILRSLPSSWMPKVTAIQEAKDLSTITLEQLAGSLTTHEMVVNSRTNEGQKKDRGLALKVENDSESDEMDEEMALITKKFRKFYRKDRNRERKESSSKIFKKSDLGCFKCGKQGHRIKECPTWKEEQSKDRLKEKKIAAKKEYKKAMMAAWGSDSEESDSASTEEANFFLMANEDTDSEEEEDVEVTHATLRAKIPNLSKPSLIKLLNTLMDEYVEINDDKNCLLKLCEKLEEKLCVVKEQQEKKSQKIKWLEEEKIRLEETVSSQKEQSQKVKLLEEEKARLEETVSS